MPSRRFPRARQRYNPVEGRCLACGETIFSLIRGRERRYCNTRCWKRAHGQGLGPPDRICACCESAFKGNARAVYCSTKCRAQAWRKRRREAEKFCSCCGKGFTGRRKLFCSVHCRRQSTRLLRFDRVSARRQVHRDLLEGRLRGSRHR
jgi:hypothetical protein